MIPPPGMRLDETAQPRPVDARGTRNRICVEPAPQRNRAKRLWSLDLGASVGTVDRGSPVAGGTACAYQIPANPDRRFGRASFHSPPRRTAPPVTEQSQHPASRRCPFRDTGSHAPRSSDARPNVNAGVAALDARDPRFANLETLAGGPLPRMPTGSELRFAMNSGATPAPTQRSQRCLRVA